MCVQNFVGLISWVLLAHEKLVATRRKFLRLGYACIHARSYACMEVHARSYVCPFVYVPLCLVVSVVCCDFKLFLSRRVMINSAMHADASSRATSRNSIAIILHAECTAAASTKS